ncbi:hypothetical protein V1511DRAFT_499903 [Dipodascopsis uninucleata]
MLATRFIGRRFAGQTRNSWQIVHSNSLWVRQTVVESIGARWLWSRSGYRMEKRASVIETYEAGHETISRRILGQYHKEHKSKGYRWFSSSLERLNHESKKKEVLRQQKELESSDRESNTEHKDKGAYASFRNAVTRHLSPPTKEELLRTATSAFERLKIRFKWTLLRQVRPFNMDDMSAFFSWLIVGNVLWVLLGTTTFFSLVILTANTVLAQETIAKFVGNYLTRETGLTVVFESAIVPHWRDGVISFRNVFVSRRPGNFSNKFTKGSQATAAAAAAAAASSTSHSQIGTDGVVTPGVAAVVDDGNYTQFDLTVDQVNVTLSLRKWMNGRGILKDVEVKGIRGLIDRTYVRWLPNVDPRSHRRKHKPGDFEIDHFVLEDALVTLLQPNGFRPFEVSIFSCELPQLRKQWLFYDLLCANHMSGSFDDSLFTIHPRQTLNSTSNIYGDEQDSPWKKTSRLRIDGVNIDHLNRGIDQGPFSWITSGDVDIIADMMIPQDNNDAKFLKFMQDIAEVWEQTMMSRRGRRDRDALDNDTNSDNSSGLAKMSATAMKMLDYLRTKTMTVQLDDSNFSGTRSLLYMKEPEKYTVFDLRVQLNNVRAQVPLLAPELSYVNNALVRPIVAYINTRNTYIPVNFRVVKKVSEFDGSWTAFDSGLMYDLSAEVYEAFAKNVQDDEVRARRMKKVGIWSLHLALQVFLMSIGTLAI